MSLPSAYQCFESLGAHMYIEEADFVQRAMSVKALVFDWDGVFHGGQKNHQGISTYSEVDSMGVGMLRFGYYLRHRQLPKTIIISGEKNPTAFALAKRDHFDAVLFGIKHKIAVADWLAKQYGIMLSEILFVFDDILDFSLAEKVGLRLMVGRSVNPMLHRFSEKKNLVDYCTAHDGSRHALRECSELVLSAIGRFDETTEKRMKYEGDYETFYHQRNQIVTDLITYATHGGLEKVQIET